MDYPLALSTPLGTFYKLGADNGIEWKPLMPYTRPQRPQKARSARQAYPIPERGTAEKWGTPRPNNTMILDGRMIYGELLPAVPVTDLPATWHEPTIAGAAPAKIPPFTPAEAYPAERDEPTPPGYVCQTRALTLAEFQAKYTPG